MSLWPWMAVAGLGAHHGVNPATGWMFAFYSRDSSISSPRECLPTSS